MSRDKLGCLLFVIVLALMLFISMSEGQDDFCSGEDCYIQEYYHFPYPEYQEYYEVCTAWSLPTGEAYVECNIPAEIKEVEKKTEQDKLKDRVINAVRGIDWFGS